MEPGGQIVGRHPQGAALLPGVKRQGIALQRLHMEVQALPVRDGLGERKLPPLLQDAVRFAVRVQVRVVDDVVDVAGGQVADVCLDLLAVDRSIRRLTAAVTDGSTGADTGPVRAAAGRRRRHLSGSAHGDLAADAIDTAADAGTALASERIDRCIALNNDILCIFFPDSTDGCAAIKFFGFGGQAAGAIFFLQKLFLFPGHPSHP